MAKNEKNSTYTTLYWLIQDKKIKPDIFFNFLDFFWPKFIKKNEYIFLKEKYNKEELNRLIKQKNNPEYWMNMLTLNDFFSMTKGSAKNSTILAKALAEIWKTKLQKDFPDRQFIVKFIHDKEYGDYGLTFYQIKNNFFKY